MAPEDIHGLVPRICDCVSHTTAGTADMTKVRSLRWEIILDRLWGRGGNGIKRPCKERGRQQRQTEKRWGQQQRVERHRKHTCGCYTLVQVLTFEVLFSTRKLSCILDPSSFLVCSPAALLTNLFHFFLPSDLDLSRTKAAFFPEALRTCRAWQRQLDRDFRGIATIAYARTVSMPDAMGKCLPGYPLTSPETYPPAQDMAIQVPSQLAALWA